MIRKPSAKQQHNHASDIWNRINYVDKKLRHICNENVFVNSIFLILYHLCRKPLMNDTRIAQRFAQNNQFVCEPSINIYIELKLTLLYTTHWWGVMWLATATATWNKTKCNTFSLSRGKEDIMPNERAITFMVFYWFSAAKWSKLKSTVICCARAGWVDYLLGKQHNQETDGNTDDHQSWH